eukprot:CAMPEP_0116879296 /NCGR_PEP_ID=MMETSP0463-20121206/11093_1 /TAXON_ID=181622 /ORGANISM="Strombidinopsis sp, Strain SopsisLIS2011" /LENGTH=369 /DNA_ID=CAMNT_0004528469 /DNA_START=287 /DNA_END=1396 /DNA_ORIENTATION=-
MRDMSFIDELMRTKMIIQLLNKKLEEGDADIDPVEYSMAAQMLEYKLNVLESLNYTSEADTDDMITINLVGINKSIQVDKKKLSEAITILDKPVEERQATVKKDDFVPIPTEGITEEEYLEKAIELIGELKKTPRKTLDKDTFIKVFKYTGEFGRMRSKGIKKTLQDKRCAVFEKDSKAYLEELKSSINEEEKAFEGSSQIMFDKLCISPECFERTQQELMNDPIASIELFNMGMSMEQPSVDVPEELSREWTIELVKASNDYAFDLFKKEYMNVLSSDPMLVPVLVSAAAHDWVRVKHEFNEDTFKAALFKHKIYEDGEVAQHMQMKQMELMSLAAQANPMMMAQMMQGGMGGNMNMPPMGPPNNGMF